MSESKIPDRLAGVDRRVAGRDGIVDPNDPLGTWLGRPHKGVGRHSAITRNLYNWHSYKNWADKVRGDWEDKERKR